MLGVMDIYALRRKVVVEGKSQRSVAREMGLARDTVRRNLETPTPERQERRRAEVYIPLVHRPGEEVQVDCFLVTVELNGERRRVWKFLVRLMHSDCVFGLAP